MRARQLEAAPAQSKYRPQGLDLLLSGLIAALTLLVHDVSYLLRAPYWLDESWVAVSTVLPVGALGRVSASTPVGWTLLLRAVPGGDEAGRLLPLAFGALAVLAAYWLIFWLDWPSDQMARLAAILGSLAVLLAPTSLVRNDLKQYTADAFFAVVVLSLASGLERDWCRWRLVRLGVVVTVGFLFSLAAGLVGAVVLVAFLIVLLARRDGPKLGELAIFGGVCAVLLAVIYLLAYRPGVAPGLHQYWAGYFIPSPGAGTFVSHRATELSRYIGFGHLPITLALVLAGVLTCLWLRQPAMALAAPLLVCVMIALAATGRYPLFDERTAHFVSIVLLVYAVIGVVGICHLLRWIHPTISAVALLAVGLLFGSNAIPDLRSHSIPVADLRTPTRYVADHAAPDDVVLTSSHSSWGVAYYWAREHPDVHPVTAPNASTLQRFVAVLPAPLHEVVASDRTAAALAEALHTALASGRPIWIIRGPLNAAEEASWAKALEAEHVSAQQVLGKTLLRIAP